MITILSALFFGSLSGLLYGYIFLTQKRNILLGGQTNSSRATHLMRSFIFTAARFLPLLMLWFSLLLSPSINHILLISSFFGMFWLVVLKKGLMR